MRVRLIDQGVFRAGTMAAAAMLLLVMPQMATAICCVCEGSVASNCASGPPDCSECESVCNTVGATMRACCETADCSQGVADDCEIGTLCQQVDIGPGFCDGTCTTAPAPVLAPGTLLIAVALLLGGLGAFELRRRARSG